MTEKGELLHFIVTSPEDVCIYEWRMANPYKQFILESKIDSVLTQVTGVSLSERKVVWATDTLASYLPF